MLTNSLVKPIVSIIIPMYNAEKFISETINSILKQSCSNFEIIIVDNCSNDTSREIVKSFIILDTRIKLIELEYNSGGPARPRNIGVENAIGEYISFLDADDLWLPQKLEKHLKFIKDNNLNFSSHGAIFIDEKSKRIKTLEVLKSYYRRCKKYDLTQLVKGNFIYLSSVILEKNIFEKFNEEEDCIAVEDYYLWLNLFNKENVKYGYFHKNFLKYRIVSSSISNRNIFGKQQAKAMYYTLKFIIDNQKFNLFKYIKK